MRGTATPFLRELCATYHREAMAARLAPSMCRDAVLSVMGKPRNLVVPALSERFARQRGAAGTQKRTTSCVPHVVIQTTLNQRPSSWRCCRDLGPMPDRCRDFYPASTMSTAMYFTAASDRTHRQPVYVPKKSPREGAAAPRSSMRSEEPQEEARAGALHAAPGHYGAVSSSEQCLLRPQGQGGGGRVYGARAGWPLA